MRLSAVAALAVLLAQATACSSAADDAAIEIVDSASDEGAALETAADTAVDAQRDTFVAETDATIDGAPEVAVDGDAGCFVDTVGTFGECLTLPACAALGDHVSTPGYCPGPSSIECCTPAPNVADNPPVPAGWKLMKQADVTSDMTTWAVSILHDPTTYPMFSTTTRMFGTLDVLARVEWHPPDFLNSAIHRGVTLYSR